MRILLIAGNDRNSDSFKEQLLPRLSLLQQNKVFSANPENKLGLLCPGKRNQVKIESGGLIVFEVNSTPTTNSEIPGLTPRVIQELNGFLNEFQPEIIHSYDEGYIGLIAQFFSETKKIPFVLTLPIKNTNQKRQFASKIIQVLIKQTGITREFIRNFYNHAATIIGSKEAVKNLKVQGLYKGAGVDSETVSNSGDLLELYTRLIKQYKSQARFKRKFVPLSLLITSATIIGSILSFSALKGYSKLKHNLINKNNTNEQHK